MRGTLAERFWAKVDRKGPDECWEWQAGKRHNGYGQIRKGSCHDGMLQAHRVSWELHNGLIPEGLHVLHHCDNPACVNPAHLFLGTEVDNKYDMVEKGRQARGEKHGGAKLSERDVLRVRNLIEEGWEQQNIAKLLMVSTSTISMINTGKLWGWLQ